MLFLFRIVYVLCKVFKKLNGFYILYSVKHTELKNKKINILSCCPVSPIRTYLLLRGQEKRRCPWGWPFLLSLMSVFVGLGAEQLTKEATVLRGLSLILSRRVYGKLAPMEEGDPCPRRVWYLPSRSSSPGICPRQAGVSRPPPPSRHFIPGISGWFVGLTLLCLQPHSHSEFSFVLLRELGALMPLPLGLAVGAPADMGAQVRAALIFWRARQAGSQSMAGSLPLSAGILHDCEQVARLR